MARQGEPTFEIRAQDKFMPDVLNFWADQVERAVANTINSDADRSKAKSR